MERIAVLASGGGSNLQALLDYLASRAAAGAGGAGGAGGTGGAPAGRVALVVSDRSGAGALTRARAADVPTAIVDPRAEAGSLAGLLESHAITLVALAGYLRIVPREVVRRYLGRMLNVHPALLPAFGGQGMYGARVHRAVLASGARVSGVTVHFVDEEYDRGPIAAQWPVPVFSDDTEETLAARVLRIEHLLYPRVIDAVAARRLTLGPGGVVVGAATLPRADPIFTLSPASTHDPTSAIDALFPPIA